MRPPERLFRALVALYPRDYRRAYGEEMVEVYRHRFRERASGPLGWLRAALDATVDGVSNAARIRVGRSRGGFAWRPDLTAVLRRLLRAPGFSAAAVAILAGAVAVNAAVYAFLRGSLFDPPPWEAPEEVVIAWGSNPLNGQVRDVISGSNYVDLARRATTLERIAAFHGDGVALMRDGRPIVLDAIEVTVDFLGVLGVEPAFGSGFSESDRTSGGEARVLVSHAFWRDELGSDPEAVGTTLPLDGEPTTVAGVLPEDFRFAGSPTLLVPLHEDELAAESRTHHHYHVVARLAAGATASAATRELSAVFTEIAREDPRMNGWSVLVEPILEVSVEAVRPVLWLLAAAVGLVLAIAAVNLATLFRIRTLERTDELHVRRALGAGRGRILASLIAETGILSLAGGLVGVLLADPLLSALTAAAPPVVPIPGSAAMVPALQASLDLPVRLVALGAAVAAGLLVAAPSILAVLRGGVGQVARTGRRVRGGLRSGWLVAAQVALATVLTVGAGVTLGAATRAGRADLGLEPRGLLTLMFGDVDSRSPTERAEYFRRVLERVAEVPGVEGVGTNDYLPFLGEDDFQGIVFPDRPSPAPGEGVREEWRRVSEGLFEAAGMRIVRGRGFEAADFDGTPAAVVVNEAFARRHYPGLDPVGRRITVTESGYRDVEIVGVVADVLARGPSRPAPPVLYAPYQAWPRGHVALYVRTAGDPMALAAAVQEAIWSVDPTQPIVRVLPMTELVRWITAVERMLGGLVGGLAALALLLSAVGVFGVAGYAVTSRRGELGIRLALGATASRIRSEVIGREVLRLGWAVVAGAGVAWWAAGRGASLVPGLEGPGLPVLVVAAALVWGMALLAAWLPARRVGHIDPADVIRSG